MSVPFSIHCKCAGLPDKLIAFRLLGKTLHNLWLSGNPAHD